MKRRTLLALAGLLPFAARAHDLHVHADKPPAAGKPPASVKIQLADTPLVDQQGRAVRLKTDVLAGRIVVVDFVYTTCTTICPIFTATMANLQGRLGHVLGSQVQLVTVTVDPLRDTPQRLKDYAEKQRLDPAGWTWLTGKRADVDTVNKAFGSYTPKIDDHPPMVLVGDPDAGQWTRFFGFPTADELEGRVRQLLDARKARTS